MWPKGPFTLLVYNTFFTTEALTRSRQVYIKKEMKNKHGSHIHNPVETAIDPSIVDLKWEKTLKEIMEIKCLEKVGLEALDLISPIVKTENWGSVEETVSQVKTMDKVTVEITSSCNRLGRAIGTGKLERVRVEDHSLAWMGN